MRFWPCNETHREGSRFCREVMGFAALNPSYRLLRRLIHQPQIAVLLEHLPPPLGLAADKRLEFRRRAAHWGDAHLFEPLRQRRIGIHTDRKSTRLNSSHSS